MTDSITMGQFDPPPSGMTDAEFITARADKVLADARAKGLLPKPMTASERLAYDRRRALELIAETYHDFADQLDWEDADDFKWDCITTLKDQGYTEIQQRRANEEYRDAHPPRPH